jgi:hypothetical protein
MVPNNRMHNTDDHEEPMESELFELAAREVNWHLSPGETDWKDAAIVQAVRQVLVDGRRTTAVAEAAGISQAWLSQAIGRVREQLEAICARENWVYKMVVLPPDTMALVEHMQTKAIDPLKQLQIETLAKKKAKKIKAVDSNGDAKANAGAGKASGDGKLKGDGHSPKTGANGGAKNGAAASAANTRIKSNSKNTVSAANGRAKAKSGDRAD